jgi:asparagine synthase (glutamine-hydrolysing)
MCGIAGVRYFDGREPSERLLRRMSDCIVHRGPDDEGVWIGDGTGLSFRRLSIIDLAEGRQPLSNEDETVWIVFNGEIYNYLELREQLQARGHRFKTRTDTEVIVHLYEEYGEACVDRLRGMFGFVIWDRRNRTLFGARDPFGIKPFYYIADGEKFAFASEIKSLLTLDVVRREVDLASLANYLTFQYVPDPDTMFKGIRKLPPAHTVTIDGNGRTRIRRYWDPMFEPVRRPIGEFIEQIREKLKDSVKHHMQSDVNRGCFLSSGIDSTAIATLMREIEPIKTFSVGFDGPNNETLIAADTARAIGTDHHARVITEDDYFASLPRAVWHQDEPVADPSAIALYHVAKLAREHVTVVLSGEGADELFGGYRIYREPQALRALSWLPEPVRGWVHRGARRLPDAFRGKNYVLRATTPLERRFLGNAKIFGEADKAALLAADPAELHGDRGPWAIAAPYYDKTKHLDPVTRMQYIDLNLWMPGDILMKADKMTMAHSLELRVPFLDRELFELVRTIPAEYRIAGGTTKYVLRKAMEGIVPDFILNRPKLGFPVPIRDWLKGARGLQILEEMRTREMADYFRPEALEALMTRHRNGDGDHSRKLWIIYMFALWHKAYVSEAPRAGAVRRSAIG